MKKRIKNLSTEASLFWDDTENPKVFEIKAEWGGPTLMTVTLNQGQTRREMNKIAFPGCYTYSGHCPDRGQEYWTLDVLTGHISRKIWKDRKEDRDNLCEDNVFLDKEVAEAVVLACSSPEIWLEKFPNLIEAYFKGRGDAYALFDIDGEDADGPSFFDWQHTHGEEADTAYFLKRGNEALTQLPGYRHSEKSFEDIKCRIAYVLGWQDFWTDYHNEAVMSAGRKLGTRGHKSLIEYLIEPRK